MIRRGEEQASVESVFSIEDKKLEKYWTIWESTMARIIPSS